MTYIQPPKPCPACGKNIFEVAPDFKLAETVQFVRPDVVNMVKRQIMRQPAYDAVKSDEHIIDGYICKNCGFVSFYSRTMLDSIYSSQE